MTMVEGEASPGLFPQSVGERLRVMREQAGLDLNDIGTRTRIPLRHLAAIERGDYAALPSQTYSLGFTKAYARALGQDDTELIRDLRGELGREDPVERAAQSYEPADPSRVPPRMLAWTALALAVLFAIGYGVWRTDFYGDTPATPAPEVAIMPPPPATARPAAPAAVPRQVVLTAISPVWLRIYEAQGAKLFEKEMAAGERYEVPQSAARPQILTGRPDALRVTIDGREVAPLGPPEKTIADLDIGAAALAARPAVPAANP